MSCSSTWTDCFEMSEDFSENITLANYGVLFILHLIVFLVTFHKVYVADAGIFIDFVSKHYFVTICPSNGITSLVSPVPLLLYTDCHFNLLSLTLFLLCFEFRGLQNRSELFTFTYTQTVRWLYDSKHLQREMTCRNVYIEITYQLDS